MDFLKQLAMQFKSIWDHLNATQRIILVSTFAVSVMGFVAVMTWSSMNGTQSGHATLFVNLDGADAAKVTEALKESGTSYKLENDGRTLLVPKKDLYEVRMQMARLGLPQKGGQGYEIFDKVKLGMTEFVQNLNFRRALEGELSRTIESLAEVDKARVHVTIPKPSLFSEQKEEATASVILMLRPGAEITPRQVKGITHLLASSVEGLKSRQVSVLDVHGNLLTRGFADNDMAEQTDHNLSIQREVETHLERKILDIFQGLLGPGKAKVKVAAELDFDQVKKSVESYDPNTRVVRSQQRDDGMTRGSPMAELEQKEGSITNYEFDKTMAHIISSPGARQRVTVSVVVDGTYETLEDGTRNFVPRTPEELEKFNAIVKNTVGYSPGTKDEVFVTSVRFDNQYLLEEQQEMVRLQRQETYQFWGKIGIIAAIVIFALIFLRGLTNTLISAMNPPAPKYAALDLSPKEPKIPEEVQKQKEILERVEVLTQTEPINIANLIKSWIHEGNMMENGSGGGNKSAASQNKG